MQALSVILTAGDLANATEDATFPQWPVRVQGTDTSDPECRAEILISEDEASELREATAGGEPAIYQATQEQVSRKLTMGHTGEEAVCMPVEHHRSIGTIRFTRGMM